MEVALTFGSLGDIIAVCQLAIQLGRAIGVGSGAVGNSAKEYQDFREDLDSFVRILMQVVATYQQHEPSPYLNGLDSVAKSIIDQCGSLIQDTLEHVHPKYHDSLRVGGSGKKVKDIYRKVEWMTRETDRLRHVREKLQDGVQRLSLLTTLAARKSARVDNATLCARIEEINRLVSNTCHSREEILELLRDQGRASEKQADKLEDMSQQLVVQEESGRDILGLAKATFRGILEAKALLVQISQTVINLQVMASHSIFLRPLDPTKELPAVLEDALGNEFPIPVQLLDSIQWEALHQLLTGRFKDRKGYGMVLKREYALEDSSSGRDLDTNRPLHFCLRRGMKINMSMVFDAATVVAGACPRCHTETDAPEDFTVQCMRPDCGMWFRMQSIVIEASETSDALQGSDVKSVPAGQRSTIVTSIPVEPADFQRVRLLRQETSGLQPASTQIDMNLEPGSLARHSPLPITASASKGEGEEFRTNPYPAPPIYGQRNDDPNYSYNPAYSSGNRWDQDQEAAGGVENPIRNPIHEIVQKGLGTQVMLQFIRFGNGEVDKRYLSFLDNYGLDLGRDFIDTKPVDGNLYEMLFGAVDPSIDESRQPLCSKPPGLQPQRL